ncbi:Uncharacterised protein [Vibrio cholerae]|uniref:Uncharacterized protein n=1 Tax=Vibrio cholerae TaxID=666 RepID=A0A655P0B6_VIBCL|nr:Uncharacterised protein [Vibrio cholerae]
MVDPMPTLLMFKWVWSFYVVKWSLLVTYKVHLASKRF